MWDGANSQPHICGVTTACGAAGQPFEVAFAFADLSEATEEVVGVVEKVVDLTVEAAIQRRHHGLADEYGCGLPGLRAEQTCRSSEGAGRHRVARSEASASLRSALYYGLRRAIQVRCKRTAPEFGLPEFEGDARYEHPTCETTGEYRCSAHRGEQLEQATDSTRPSFVRVDFRHDARLQSQRGLRRR